MSSNLFLSLEIELELKVLDCLLFLIIPAGSDEMVVVKPKMIAEVPPRILLQLVKLCLSLWVEAAGRVVIGPGAWQIHSMSFSASSCER